MEKAYDRIHWEFLCNTVIEIGIPIEFINIIMHCVTSCSMQILWYGE